MAKVTGLTYEQARGEQQKLKDAGREGGKAYGKLEDYIKTLKPENYGVETVASARAKLANSTQSPTAGATASVPVNQGSIDLNGIYDSLFNTPEIQAKQAEVADVEKRRDEAITSNQNNPWYSQATRGGKIAAVKSDAERNLMRINNELTRLQTDAQIKYGIQMDQYNINRQAYQDALSLFNGLVNSGALQNANESDIANLSVRTGIPTSMINSIIANNQTLTLRAYGDDSGQYVLALDPQGNVVNRSFLGAGKSNTSDMPENPFEYVTEDSPVPQNDITSLWLETPSTGAVEKYNKWASVLGQKGLY